MNQRRIVASGPTFSGVAEIEAQEYRTFSTNYVFAGVAGASRSYTERLQTTILHILQIRGAENLAWSDLERLV